MRRPGPIAWTALLAAVAADAVVVVLFAGFGRRSHEESSGVAGVLGTAAPFLCALAVVWVGAVAIERAREHPPDGLLRLDAGVVIALVTTALGMVLRRTLWDRGTALAFVIITAMFFTVCFGGWRAGWRRLQQRRRAPAR